MTRPMLAPDVFDPATATLYGSHCPACGVAHFPPKEVCPDCFAGGVERTPLSRRGIVYGHTTVHAAPPSFSPPYVLVQVDLPEGVRLVGQLVGVAEDTASPSGLEVVIESGPVRVDDGHDIIGYRFVPT